jgi:hypothetical protein
VWRGAIQRAARMRDFARNFRTLLDEPGNGVGPLYRHAAEFLCQYPRHCWLIGCRSAAPATKRNWMPFGARRLSSRHVIRWRIGRDIWPLIQ